MKKRATLLLVGVLIGGALIVGVILLLIRTLAAPSLVYDGQPPEVWMHQLNSRDASISNRANQVLNTQIIPGLVNQMFHDTNDSAFRLSLIKAINRLPGARVDYSEAVNRRTDAALDLGNFGPPATSAVPALILALQGPQNELHQAAIESLGKIHSNPEIIVPLLTQYLTNNDLNEDATIALANYGRLAREAFPKIVPLIHASDRHTRSAARYALKQIDPAAAEKFEVEPQGNTGK